MVEEVFWPEHMRKLVPLVKLSQAYFDRLSVYVFLFLLLLLFLFLLLLLFLFLLLLLFLFLLLFWRRSRSINCFNLRNRKMCFLVPPYFLVIVKECFCFRVASNLARNIVADFSQWKFLRLTVDFEPLHVANLGFWALFEKKFNVVTFIIVSLVAVGGRLQGFEAPLACVNLWSLLLLCVFSLNCVCYCHDLIWRCGQLGG